MNKSLRRHRSIALLLVAVLLLSGCVGKDNTVAKPGPGQVIDGAGVIKNIPDDPASATIASVYAVSVPLIVALDLSDRVLAVNVKSKFWTDADEDLARAGTVGRGIVDLEALATYAPTTFIHRSNDPETVEAVEKLGIDVLCITVENIDDIRAMLTMLGAYFGAEDRAEAVIEWIDGKFSKIRDIVKKIPEDERVTAMLMGGQTGRVAGDDMLQSWMIEQAGGLCVVDEGEDHRWINVGVEKVFNWNPEYIFCTSSTALDYTPEELLNDPTWSAVQAIIDENVFVMPARIDSWDMPGISCVLGALFMLHTMYPDYYSIEELNSEIDEYYMFMFGKTFDSEYLGYSLEG
ncbi:MAG: ABC transporter substrate-binding protein [Clostridiaceae bacterium]|jgi:ABC-type Fe3+-hydroxamate transport system substrate-binding protein|nr:ABC transporter substrate-binding protein [Clostridiaceae bacterium]